MYFDVKLDEKKTDWKSFEKRVGDIFESFDYKTERNVTFKTSRRFEIDIIAYDGERCFFIDCKDHAYIPPKTEIEFIEKQRIRALNFFKIRPELKRGKSFVLLVTRNKTPSLLNHENENDRVLAVDMDSLRHLLVNLPVYETNLYTI